MWRVTILNQFQNLSWSAQFLTETDAQNWLNSQIGKPWRTQGEFTYEIVDITAEHSDKLNKQQKILEGARARQACQNVLDLVAGYNLDNDLSAEQITQMQTTFSSIFQLLLANRPSSAKALINAIEPDGVIVSAQMKQDCLDLLSGY